MHFLVTWNEDGRTRRGELVDIFMVEDREKYKVQPIKEGSPRTLDRFNDVLKIEPRHNLPNPGQPKLGGVDD